jgi:hypothetical protein
MIRAGMAMPEPSLAAGPGGVEQRSIVQRLRLKRIARMRDWLGAHAFFALLRVVGRGVVIVLAVRVFLPTLNETWRDLLDGAVILRTPGRYLRCVALPETVGYVVRIVGTRYSLAQDAVFTPGTSRSGPSRCASASAGTR